MMLVYTEILTLQSAIQKQTFLLPHLIGQAGGWQGKRGTGTRPQSPIRHAVARIGCCHPFQKRKLNPATIYHVSALVCVGFGGRSCSIFSKAEQVIDRVKGQVMQACQVLVFMFIMFNTSLRRFVRLAIWKPS